MKKFSRCAGYRCQEILSEKGISIKNIFPLRGLHKSRNPIRKRLLYCKKCCHAEKIERFGICLKLARQTIERFCMGKPSFFQKLAIEFRHLRRERHIFPKIVLLRGPLSCELWQEKDTGTYFKKGFFFAFLRHGDHFFSQPILAARPIVLLCPTTAHSHG